MPDVSAVAHVAAPAQRVYACLTDFPRLPRVLDGVDSVEQPKPGRLVLRHGGSRRAVRAEIVENVIGARLAWTPAGGEPGESVAFTIDDLGDASRVTLALSGVPGDRREEAQARVERSLARLRDIVEGEGAPPVPPAPMAGRGDPGGPATPPPPLAGSGDPGSAQTG